MDVDAETDINPAEIVTGVLMKSMFQEEGAYVLFGDKPVVYTNYFDFTDIYHFLIS